jgi:hypothetical protein
MKTWVALFLILLAAGICWGLARDLLSRQRATLSGTVVSFAPGNAIPKWLSATPPRYKVRLPDGRLVDVATQDRRGLPVGGRISVTEWVTPWGQVWYTQPN